MTDWSSLLDDMERRVAEVDRVLMDSGPPISALQIPDDLGPLPVELRQRAERVYALTVEAEFRIEAAQAGLLAAVRPSRETPPPAYFDRTA